MLQPARLGVIDGCMQTGYADGLLLPRRRTMHDNGASLLGVSMHASTDGSIRDECRQSKQRLSVVICHVHDILSHTALPLLAPVSEEPCPASMLLQATAWPRDCCPGMK